MKLDKAYSLDLKKNIAASEADTKYVSGEVSSKFAFTCPGKNCDAQVTCANLDRPKNKRKRDPYYKIVGEHSKSCAIHEDIEPTKKRKTVREDIYSDSDEYYDHAVRLDVRPPSRKRPDDGASQGEDIDLEVKGKPSTTDEGGKRKIQPSRRLSSLVSAFRNNEPLTLQVPDEGTMSIQDFFVEIDGQDIESLEDSYRVYYGKGWINKNEKGYSVRFTNSLKYNELVVRPSFFIPLALVEASSYRKFQLSTLDKLANKIPKDIYILCETGPRPHGDYINFWLDGLEYMEYQL